MSCCEERARKNMQWLLKILVAGFLIAIVLVSNHRAKSGSSDFDVYYYAGKAVLTDEALYTINRHSVNQSSSPYVYPPFFACLISALALFPIGVSAAVWNLFNIGFFAASLVIIRNLLNTGGITVTPFRGKQLVFTFFVTILFILILIDNIAMAQVNLFVLFLFLLGFQEIKKKQHILGGFWLGAATAVKLIPVIFFVYFAVKRQWKVLWGGLIAFIFCFWLFPMLVLGPAKNSAYLKSWYQETLQDQTEPETLGFYSTQLNPSHQNLQAVIFRLVIDWEFRERTGGAHGKEFFFRTPLRLTEKQAGNVARGMSLAVLLILVASWIWNRKKANPNFDLQEIAATLSAMFLLSPKARSHFFIFLLLPYILLLKEALVSGDKKIERQAKGTLVSSVIFYFLQTIQYFKYLGAGAWSALILFFYFLRRR